MNDKALLDITKGTFDELEIGKFVTRFVLYKLCHMYQRKDLLIYRNYELAVFENKWPSFHKFSTPFSTNF